MFFLYSKIYLMSSTKMEQMLADDLSMVQM